MRLAIPLGLQVTLASLVLVAAIFFVGVRCGLAAEPCHGHLITASYYGTESGSRTADGSYFDGRSMTAAMPSRSHLGERWRVTYRGRSVVVRVNDLGPAAYLHRGMDLSHAAAVAIGLVHAGVGKVCAVRL